MRSSLPNDWIPPRRATAGHAGSKIMNNSKLKGKPKARSGWFCCLNALRSSVIGAFSKILQPFGNKEQSSGLFGFWRRFGSVTGSLWTCSFAEASPNPINPRFECLQNFFKRSSSVDSCLPASSVPPRAGLSTAHDAAKLRLCNHWFV